MKGAPSFAMVTGEASGDLIASLLLEGLRLRWPGLTAYGIGGPRLNALGFCSWWPQEKLAVRGYVEVLRHYREIVSIRDQLAHRLLDKERPDIFIGVDAPDFNLHLEARLKSAGVRTVHFVCPSIWAWRGERVHKLSASADHVLCLFPFEVELLKQHGVAASYVGHPLADAIPMEPPKAAARESLGLGKDDVVVALLPGSRRSEVASIAPLFLKAASQIVQMRPGVRFVLPVVPGLRAAVDALVSRWGQGLDLIVADGRSHEALAACDVTLIASGTATLEAALFKRPMVIAYRMNPVSWQIMKRMRYQPWVGLPNILAQEFLVPERLQGDAQPTALARDVVDWLDQPERADKLAVRFRAMHDELRQDTARAATRALETVLHA